MIEYFFVGHSNGGVFGCLLAIYRCNIFNGIVSHMGGIGYDPHFYLDFTKLIGKKTPLLFYTGENDIHKSTCEAALSIFQNEEFPEVMIHIEPKIKHEYIHTCEKYILNWFNQLKY